jgi:hypothetical protein
MSSDGMTGDVQQQGRRGAFCQQVACLIRLFESVNQRWVRLSRMSEPNGIDVSVPPSGTGCLECDAAQGWWLHLRRCAQCGHVGCCDDSPSQHASAHAASSGHPLIRSFEPGESWFWNYQTEEFYDGPELAAPQSRPVDQPVPGPAGRVPADWRSHLH